MKIIISFFSLVLILVIGLNILRNADELRTYIAWDRLESRAPKPDDIFTYETISHLPEAVQAYFKYTIRSGTVLKRKVKIDMQGRLGLGPKATPDYMDMEAQQILSLEQGFIWKVRTGRGPLVMTGSDGLYRDKSWSRFWLMHTIPFGRAGGVSKRTTDHRRAAFGRLVSEAVFWSPAAFLSDNVSWRAVSDNHIQAIISYKDLMQSVDIYMDDTGQPIKVTIPRWSDANAQNTYQIQPFGGYPSNYKNFEGYILPTHIEGGNFIGTDAYFPFYIADIESIAFID